MNTFIGISFITGMCVGIEFFSHTKQLITVVDIFIFRFTLGLKW